MIDLVIRLFGISAIACTCAAVWAFRAWWRAQAITLGRPFYIALTWELAAFFFSIAIVATSKIAA